MYIDEYTAKCAIVDKCIGAVLIAVAIISITTLLVLALRRYSIDQDQEHAEHLAAIQASRDIGQTAWAQADVRKGAIIREQAKKIAELEGWKSRTMKRMKELKLSEVFDHE